MKYQINFIYIYIIYINMFMFIINIYMYNISRKVTYSSVKLKS